MCWGIAFGLLATSCDEQIIEPDTTLSTTTLTSQTTTTLSSTANLVYKETVEGLKPFSTAHDLDVGDWDYAMRFVDYPRFRGVKAARFEIREDQPLVATGQNHRMPL